MARPPVECTNLQVSGVRCQVSGVRWRVSGAGEPGLLGDFGWAHMEAVSVGADDAEAVTFGCTWRAVEIGCPAFAGD
jgi:hypothetical protein